MASLQVSERKTMVEFGYQRAKVQLEALAIKQQERANDIE